MLGQWQINGIGTLNSRLPLRMNVRGNTSHSFGGRQLPDSTGVDPKLNHQNFDPSTDKWFDPTQFTIPKPYTFGDVGRVHPTPRADFVELLDFSIFKNFKIGERVTTQFRAEWFNLLNHPIFNIPGTAVGTGSLGIVSSQANLPRQTQLALKVIF